MRKIVRAQTAARIRTLDREVRHAASNPNDADAIHNLRVSIRRLNQELKVFEEWFGQKRAKSIRGSLKELMERCAAVRNCDIAIEVLRAAGCRSPELVAGLEKEREKTREELAETLENWRKKDRVRKWRGDLRLGQSVSKESAKEYATRLLPELIDDLFRAGQGAALPNATQRKMHQFRLKTKHLRYTLELFDPVFGRKTKPVLESLKGLQDKLGAINDCATTLEMIRRDRGAAAAVRRLAREREAEFREHWKKHFGPRERVRWTAVLSAADGKK